MKIIFAISACLFSTFCHSQKDTVYTDLEGKKISQKEFYKLDDTNISIKIHDFTTPIVKSAYSVRRVRQLDSTQLFQINMYLEKVIGSKYNKTKINVIHHFRSSGNEIKEACNDKDYWLRLKTVLKQKYSSYIFGEKNSGVIKNSKKHIYIDEYNLIENIFFKKSDYNINHIVLKPSGEVSVFYGTSDLLYVLDSSSF